MGPLIKCQNNKGKLYYVNLAFRLLSKLDGLLQELIFLNDPEAYNDFEI